jgi:hypothetical protein
VAYSNPVFADLPREIALSRHRYLRPETSG